jgi:hypothetical protein
MNKLQIKRIAKENKKNCSYSIQIQNKATKIRLSSPSFGKIMCSSNVKDLLNIKRFELKLYARFTEISKTKELS